MMNIMEKIRSLLYVPADKEKMLQKSITSAADAIIYDLEDSIATEHKEMAREMLASFASDALNSGKEILVRVNNAETPFFGKDIDMVLEAGFRTIILPKAEPGVVRRASDYISIAELSHGMEETLRMVPLIESPAGVVGLAALLCESKRIIGAQMGAEDFTKEMEIPRTIEGKEVELARNLLALHCRALHISAIDTPFTDIHNLEGLEDECIRMRDMGMTAKTCIHPLHIETINRVFCPSPEQIEFAGALLAEADKEENQGKGAFSFRGKMVDVPVLERARRVIQRAELFKVNG